MSLPRLAFDIESNNALYFLMIMVDIYENKMFTAQDSTHELIALLRVSSSSSNRNVRNAHNDFMGCISADQRSFLAQHRIHDIAHAFQAH